MPTVVYDCVCFKVCAEHMLSSVVRNRKRSHGFFKSICKQCKQAGVRGGGSQLCKHFVRRSYCTKCSPGMQRCNLHPEKTKALCLKCAHLKGHGSSLCRCVYLRCTHAYTHSPHTYSMSLQVSALETQCFSFFRVQLAALHSRRTCGAVGTAHKMLAEL